MVENNLSSSNNEAHAEQKIQLPLEQPSCPAMWPKSLPDVARRLLEGELLLVEGRWWALVFSGVCVCVGGQITYWSPTAPPRPACEHLCGEGTLQNFCVFLAQRRSSNHLRSFILTDAQQLMGCEWFCATWPSHRTRSRTKIAGRGWWGDRPCFANCIGNANSIT